jgi:hypothetical protein
LRIACSQLSRSASSGSSMSRSTTALSSKAVALPEAAECLHGPRTPAPSQALAG